MELGLFFLAFVEAGVGFDRGLETLDEDQVVEGLGC